jgi:lipoyl-dependent peroxiredoxin
MPLPNMLSTAGHVPDTSRTSARVHLRDIDGATTLARTELETGHVTGIGERRFQSYSDEAKAACPVSRVVAGVPEIVLTANLGMTRSIPTDAATRGATA